MNTVFVVIEFCQSDTSTYTGFCPESDQMLVHVRGIAPTLDGAMSIVAIHKLAAIVWEEDAWQIEEVAFNAPIKPTCELESLYAIPGAIAMYDINGDFVRSPTKHNGVDMLA